MRYGYGDVSVTRRKHRLACRVSVQSVWATMAQLHRGLVKLSQPLGNMTWMSYLKPATSVKPNMKDHESSLCDDVADSSSLLVLLSEASKLCFQGQGTKFIHYDFPAGDIHWRHKGGSTIFLNSRPCIGHLPANSQVQPSLEMPGLRVGLRVTKPSLVLRQVSCLCFC